MFFTCFPKDREHEEYFSKSTLTGILNFLVSGYITNQLSYILYNHQYPISKSLPEITELFQDSFCSFKNPEIKHIDSFINILFENEQKYQQEMKEEIYRLLEGYLELIQRYNHYRNNPHEWIQKFKDPFRSTLQ